MPNSSEITLQALHDDALLAWAHTLRTWLQSQTAPLTESRARALLLAAGVLDQPMLNDFERRVADARAIRVALHDLVNSAELIHADTLPTRPLSTEAGAAWLSLAVCAYAHKIGYPAAELDPSSPPVPFSPAGQVLHQAGAWMRRQVQRSATERDRAARKLAYRPELDDVSPATAPSQPGVRREIPVRYFEYNEEIQVESDDLDRPQTTTVERGAPVTISDDDVQSQEPPQAQPPAEEEFEIKIGESRRVAPPSETHPQDGSTTETPSVRQALAENLPQLRDSIVSTAGAFTNAIRAQFRSEPLQTVKLRVIVQDTPQGRGLPAVQVKLTSPNVKGALAGTTNSRGVFTAELPVRSRSGLTYHADVTWPAQLGGQTERKSVTMNAHRSEFQLLFYHRLD